MEYKQAKKQLKNMLDKERYQHSLRVMGVCISLAMRYEYDLEKACFAGLLHDCAKCFTQAEIRYYLERYNLVLTSAERESPALIHARLGAYVARDLFEERSEEVFDAITWHTTGKADMALLTKIVYVADYIEPERNKQPNLTAIRKLAFTDIDMAVYQIARDTLSYLEKKEGTVIDQHTREVYQFYKEKVDARTIG